MRLWLFFTLLLLPLSLSALTLKEKLTSAPEGSYLVLEQNKTFTFLLICSNDGRRLGLEEVTIPGPPTPFEGWRLWYEKGAPGHTSRTLTFLHLDTGTVEEMYSCTRRGWIDVSTLDPFLTTLLNLHFEPLPEGARRRVGLPPGQRQVDTRPLWHPRLTLNGRPIPHVYFSAFTTRWPADTSELANKKIIIYLPEKREDLPFPTYFPYLVEIEGKIGSAKIRVIDSGMEVINTSSSNCPQS